MPRDTSDRRLTPGEWAGLSVGLADALRAAGADPSIRARAHPAAVLAAARFGSIPILTRGPVIWWPAANPEFAGSPTMAILQHELQHVLDYAQGRLTALRYVLWPPNWRYRWTLTAGLRWDQLGAEQRASAAEALWLSERDGDVELTRQLRQLIPWASQTAV